MSKPLVLALIMFVPLISGCLGEVVEETENETETDSTIWTNHLFNAALRLNSNATYDILVGTDEWVPAVKTGNASITWDYPVAGEGDVPANETYFCTYFSNETENTETCVPGLITENTFWRTTMLEEEGWISSCMVLAKIPNGTAIDEIDEGDWHYVWEEIVQADVDAGLQPSWCTDYY